MENYEALGRFVANKEKAKAQAITRNNALQDLMRMIQITREAEGSNTIAMDFDFTKALEILKKASDAHGDLLKAVAEANLVAHACGNQQLVIGR
ncbi:MAG: hypothetical protein L6Q53_14560 [Candidatus Brocadia sinica]|nr:hypothetical protein [Candidatus Brocadia sinica]